MVQTYALFDLVCWTVFGNWMFRWCHGQGCCAVRPKTSQNMCFYVIAPLGHVQNRIFAQMNTPTYPTFISPGCRMPRNGKPRLVCFRAFTCDMMHHILGSFAHQRGGWCSPAACHLCRCPHLPGLAFDGFLWAGPLILEIRWYITI